MKDALTRSTQIMLSELGLGIANIQKWYKFNFEMGEGKISKPNCETSGDRLVIRNFRVVGRHVNE